VVTYARVLDLLGMKLPMHIPNTKVISMAFSSLQDIIPIHYDLACSELGQKLPWPVFHRLDISGRDGIGVCHEKILQNYSDVPRIPSTNAIGQMTSPLIRCLVLVWFGFNWICSQQD